MAGRETSGPLGARADLFQDRVWVLCPTAAAEHVQRASQLIALTGAVVVTMSPEEHDRAVATTSHAAQLISSALAARLIDLSGKEVAISGQGLRDVTRLAGSNPVMWQQILQGNALEVAAAVRAIADDLAAVADELLKQPEDLSITRSLLERGNSGRAVIPGRHGAASERFALVAVQIKDEPGALAELFAAAGAVGVSLMDVRIDHLWGKPSGLVELSVRPEDLAVIRDGLRSGGFDVRG